MTRAAFRGRPLVQLMVPAATAMLLAWGGSRAGGPERSAPAAVTQAPPAWPCTLDNPPTISSIVPNDSQFTEQSSLNCFAWQQFIALNWGALAGQRGVPDPKLTPAQFGAPGATAGTVWQTYKNDYEVMRPNGAVPAAWNAAPPPPPCSAGNAAARKPGPGVHVLTMTSKFDGFIEDTAQASGQWLADQNGNVIWYEIKMNKDEFDSIVANHFYDASVQSATASTGTNPVAGAPSYQVKLPAGCVQGRCPNNGTPVTGAIELKAAWRVLTDASLYGRYLTAQAVLVNNGVCTNATVGLVGLHIIHKTVTQPQWIWTTFEQVDNVPPATPATFSNASCTCTTPILAACLGKIPGPLYRDCEVGQARGTACTPNTPPPNLTISSACPAYPTQVTRVRPISSNQSDPVTATNAAAAALIRSANPNSVFQYYELVDVLWSTSPQDTYTNQRGSPGPRTLSMSGATPDPTALPVANTVLETYVQRTTCLSCHIHAQIASGTYASDFSFVIGQAQSASKMLTARRRTLPPGLLPALRHR